MDKAPPLAVKLTDSTEKPVKKPGKAPQLAAKVGGVSHKERVDAFRAATSSGEAGKTVKSPIQVGKSVEERTKEMYGNTEGTNTGRKVEIEGMESLAERKARLAMATRGPEEAEKKGKVGSVREKLEEFKAAASASSASRPTAVAVDGSLSVAERMQLLQSTSRLEEEKPKTEAVKTGRVAELAAKLQQGKDDYKKPDPVQGPGSIAERLKAFQDAAKGSGDKQRETVIEGIPSVKERMSMLMEKGKGEEVKEKPIVVGSVKERVSLFTSGKVWRKEDDNSEEDDNDSEEDMEVQAEAPVDESPAQSRQAKVHQSLLAKYSSKNTTKTSTIPTVKEKASIENSSEVADTHIEGEEEGLGNDVEGDEKENSGEEDREIEPIPIENPPIDPEIQVELPQMPSLEEEKKEEIIENPQTREETFPQPTENIVESPIEAEKEAIGVEEPPALPLIASEADVKTAEILPDSPHSSPPLSPNAVEDVPVTD